jgi:hypothetical protein
VRLVFVVDVDFLCNFAESGICVFPFGAEYHFQEFAPSHLAAAIVCASRRLLRIQPWWPSALVALTGYDECTIQRALLLIEQHYRAHFAAPLEVGLTPVALP